MKIIYIIVMLAAVVIGGLYYRGHEMKKESEREVARVRVSRNKHHETMRDISISSAERLFNTLSEMAKEERDRSPSSVAVEQLYQTKLLNLRSERDESIRKAHEQYQALLLK